MSTLHKKNFLLFIFFSFLALSIFSPIASNEYIPNSADFSNHIVNIIQAKQALSEGQFPVRVAPSLYDGFRYPYYQFYSPLVYTLAGAIHYWLTPDNPFIAFKLLLWIFLVLGGFAIFRLTKEFVYSDSVALLASVLYLMAPYLLVDINARGDLTEAIAACLVPFVLYCNVRCQRWPSLNVFLGTAMAWFALATIHIVIFMCTVLFIGLFVIIYNIQESLPLRRLALSGAALLFGCVLALWYFVPIVLLASHLYAHAILSNPFYYRWLAPLPTLFSVSPVSPMPLPGNGRLHFPFYVSIGWPMLLAMGFIIYKKLNNPSEKLPRFVTSLVFLFLLALFLVWTPWNVWRYLPEYSKAVQFGYRFMIQLMWIGTLLFAWAIANLFQNKLDVRHVLIGMLLIGGVNGEWLQTNQSQQKTVTDLMHDPKLSEWGASSFVVTPDYADVHLGSRVEAVGRTHGSAPTISAGEAKHFCHQTHTVMRCNFNFLHPQTVQLPLLFYPKMLAVTINGQAVSYQPIPWQKVVNDPLFINPMLVAVTVPAGQSRLTEHYIGIRWANTVSKIAWGAFLLLIIINLMKRLRPK